MPPSFIYILIPLCLGLGCDIDQGGSRCQPLWVRIEVNRIPRPYSSVGIVTAVCGSRGFCLSFLSEREVAMLKIPYLEHMTDKWCTDYEQRFPTFSSKQFAFLFLFNSVFALCNIGVDPLFKNFFYIWEFTGQPNSKMKKNLMKSLVSFARKKF